MGSLLRALAAQTSDIPRRNSDIQEILEELVECVVGITDDKDLLGGAIVYSLCLERPNVGLPRAYKVCCFNAAYRSLSIEQM